MNPATVADVQSRFLRTLTEDEERVATTLLSDAWDDLTTKIPDLEDRITSGDIILTSKAVRVVSQAVIRVLKNPNARKQESRGLDDSQRSWTLDDSVASGELYFTDEELDSLLAAGDTSTTGKAFSVMPS